MKKLKTQQLLQYIIILTSTLVTLLLVNRTIREEYTWISTRWGSKAQKPYLQYHEVQPATKKTRDQPVAIRHSPRVNVKHEQGTFTAMSDSNDEIYKEGIQSVDVRT